MRKKTMTCIHQCALMTMPRTNDVARPYPLCAQQKAFKNICERFNGSTATHEHSICRGDTPRLHRWRLLQSSFQALQAANGSGLV